jgi:hypothetical protein
MEDISKTPETAPEEKPAETPKVPAVKMQHVFITLSDGRRGVFMGPELIKAIEFKLGVVPRPVAIDFEPPREFSVPVTKEEVKEELINADQKVDDKPAAGLE